MEGVKQERGSVRFELSKDDYSCCLGSDCRGWLGQGEEVGDMLSRGGCMMPHTDTVMGRWREANGVDALKKSGQQMVNLLGLGGGGWGEGRVDEGCRISHFDNKEAGVPHTELGDMGGEQGHGGTCWYFGIFSISSLERFI